MKTIPPVERRDFNSIAPFLLSYLHASARLQLVMPSIKMYQTVKFSWNSFKISIAGARLSHLVQKDPIWDHGTMIEFVKIVFYQVQKVKKGEDMETMKKYMTETCYEALIRQVALQTETTKQTLEVSRLEKTAIIKVAPATRRHPDYFTTMLEGYKSDDDNKWNEVMLKLKISQHTFSAFWTFIRQGNWWLLHEVKP